MRITPFMIFDQLTRGILSETGRFNRLNEQMVSGKKINKPSDDVLGMKQSIDYKISIQRYEQFTRNGSQASTLINFTEQVMAQVTDVLSHLGALAREGFRNIGDDAARPLTEERVAMFRDQLLDLANSRFGDRYLFSGFKTDTLAYNTTTHAYQGNSGIMNVMIDESAMVQVNSPGDRVFSVAFSSPKVVQVGSNYVHYTAGAGTTTNVEIRASDNVTVLDSFSFSNAIEMADILKNAINAQDGNRVQAMTEPFDVALKNVMNIEAVNQLRLKRIDDQQHQHSLATNQAIGFLSKIEDADLNEVITALRKSEVAIAAMQISSSRMLQQSLMDFLK